MKKIFNILMLLTLSLTACEINVPEGITLHLNGGTLKGKSELTLTVQEFNNLKEYPVMEGKIFSSYYLDPYFNNRYDENTVINGNIDLYAKFYDDIFDYELIDSSYVISKIDDKTYDTIIIPPYINNIEVNTLKSNSFKNIEAEKVILKSIKNIEKDTFNNATINYLEISKTIKNIEYGAFRDVGFLRSVNIEQNSYYGATNNVILEKVRGSDCIIIGNYGYDKSMFNESQVESVRIIGIAPYAFRKINYYNREMDTKGFTFYIPSTISELSESAFENCKVYCYDDTTTKEIQLGTFFFDNLQKIGKNAFKNSSLTLVKFEIKKVDKNYVPSNEGIETFEEGAFQNLKLEKMIIPKVTKNIGLNCFLGCDILKDVYYEGTKEEFQQINIEEGNEALTNATIHYYSQKPEKGKWYYYCDEYAKQPYLGEIKIHQETK